ncbi:MAG: hypothetical protein AB7O32_02870 [Vicinamibacterales bacterium]
MSDCLTPIVRALDARTAPLTVFFRDDDTGWNWPALDRLLTAFEDRALPIDLAVIPAEVDGVLARALLARRDAGSIGLHQHGWSHRNHEPAGRKCEFGQSRAIHDMRADVAAGRRVMEQWFGDAVDPIFTPPWNRCVPALAALLPELGFRVLSRDRTAGPSGVDRLVDRPTTIDWFARRHGVRLTRDAWVEDAAAQCRSESTIGVLLHHAVMSDDEIRQAASFGAALASHASCRMCRLLEASGVGPGPSFAGDGGLVAGTREVPR